MNLSTLWVFGLESSKCIDIRNFDISWTNGLNNNLMVINFNGDIKYFKECKKKLSKEAEAQRIVSSYFDEYLFNKSSSDKHLLSETLRNADNLEKFISAGFLWDRNSNLSRYLGGSINSDALGIPCSIAEKVEIDLKDFFLYASRELVHRCISTGIADGELQTNLAVKQIGTYRLAKLFGIDNLVVKSEFVKLITLDNEKLGVLTDKAMGISAENFGELNCSVDPKFQRDLTCLQILDTITNEQDHNPDNCLFEVKDGRLVSLTAFDNEGCFGLNTNLHKGLCWGAVSPLLNKENMINLPHVSKSLAGKILSVESDDIRENLEDLLSNDQIDSCIKRFDCLKEALVNTISVNNNFLLDDDQWSDDTILQEISGEYDNTYLNHFLKKIGI